jgi:general secretion pathway protein L
MEAFETIGKTFSAWLDRVAEAMVAAAIRFKSIPTIVLIEGDDGRFSVRTDGKVPAIAGADSGLQLSDLRAGGRSPSPFELAIKGSRVELMLRSQRFIFKTMELPSRAAEFLTGVVRSQIDRLTPWSADHAAFGVSAPADIGAGRIAVTVAATAKEMLDPYVQTFTGLGASAVTISTRPAEAGSDAPAIAVVEKNVGGILDVRFVRRIALAALASLAVIAAAAEVASAMAVHGLQAHQDELARQIAQIRTAALASRNAPRDPKVVAEQALVRRKNETPSAVIALEILSRILPDNTYLTELRFEADKVRLTGITSNAPDLIRLIEQSHHFSQATFYAPITHAPSAPGDHFSIEARMEPDFAVTP